MGAAAALTMLGIGFLVFYSTAWLRGINPDCGCFGENKFLQATPPVGMARALGISLLAGAVWAKGIKNRVGAFAPTLN